MIISAPRTFAVAAFTSLALAAPSPASAADIEIIPGDARTPSIIDITGSIESGDADRFYELAQGVEHAVVLLHSPGGLVAEGLSIAAEIGLRGFTTIVTATSPGS